MRVLILGGAGMLGHRLALAFRDQFETWATVRGPAARYHRYGLMPPSRLLGDVDALNADALLQVATEVRPDVVINCVGIIKQLPTAQDPVQSLMVNSLLPHRLHRLCGAVGARLIHFSTDCVFSGRTGRYTEQDPSDALDLYGRTKFLGETAGAGALTIRSSIIGRELSTTSGLVEWFLSQRGRQVQGSAKAIYSGFTTHVMARIVRLILTEHPDLSGTVQISSDPIDKYSLLKMIRDAYGIAVDIQPTDSVQIDRSLDSSRFRSLAGFDPPAWRDMIEEIAADPTPYDSWRS